MVGGVTLAGFFPQKLRVVTDFLEVRVVVATALFLMAWCLESRNLVDSFLRPWPALWAVVISYAAMPVLGWIGGSIFTLADFRIGLMVSASVPIAMLCDRVSGRGLPHASLSLWLAVLFMVATGLVMVTEKRQKDLVPVEP